MRRGDRGAPVKQLQEALITLGYPLPKWGADGVLGSETLGAVARLLADHGRRFDEDSDWVSPGEVDFVFSLRHAVQAPLATPADLIDVRPHANRKHIIRRRTWMEVTGVCLHQTACVLGENPMRWASCGAHLGVTRHGRVLWIHDFDMAIVHANRFNASTVGIEMDGHYAGIEGDLKTYWRPRDAPNRMPLSPTPALVEASRATVRWVCAEVARHGGKVTHLFAHRQAKWARESDPGSALWQAVALPLMRELGLSDGGRGYHVGSGLPIPEAWDERYVGIKYRP